MQEKYEKMRLLNAYICETNAVYHELAQAVNLSDSVMQVLYTALTGEGSCTVREVCFLTGISKQTLNSALRKMESDGLLRLEAVDGRQKRICLTEAGLQQPLLLPDPGSLPQDPPGVGAGEGERI